MTEESILELKDISKAFDKTQVLKDISISIKKGEFITLLGASGCGKTTTIRIISGLTEQDAGQVILEGEDVTKFAPNKRNVNTVFQNYALFPHMNVYDNVAYGLKIRGLDKKAIREKVEKALKMVLLQQFEKRMPSELSGGQKQRVAIARAIVNEPSVLLLDEPLGALDLQLRRQMQRELKKLQQQLGITFVYITHDQEEAINMSDRIVVMREGRIEQIGTPDEIYNRPLSAYVASFVGESNVLKGKSAMAGVLQAAEEGKMEILRFSIANVVTEISNPNHFNWQDGEQLIAVRGEFIHFNHTATKQCCIPARIVEKNYAGGQLRLHAKLSDGQEVVINRQGIDAGIREGEDIYIGFDGEAAVLVKNDMEREKNRLEAADEE